jgi:pyruvate formate lyase activating enzyme
LSGHRREKKKNLIFNILRHCTEDGPGIRTTVFLKGCTMHCPWCHNPEGIKPFPELVWYETRCIGTMKCIKACPKGALTLTQKGMIIDRDRCDACGECVEACPAGALEVLGKPYKVNEVAEIVLRDRVFYEKSGGGVTLSGGEPSAHPKFSVALLQSLKGKGTAIETCAGVSWKILRPLVEVTDLVILDLKLMDKDKHLKYLGVPLELVLTNAKNIAKMGKPIWVRTPIIPKYTDSEENIRRIARFIKHNLPTVERYELLAFNKACSTKYQRLGLVWELEGEDLIPEEKMEKLADAAREEGLQFVSWSGMAKRRSSSS